MSSLGRKLKLTEFSENIYSQHGEDGIIGKIFELIGETSRVCIEFGAWDGFHLSNTANLWTHGWKGILIEGVESRYQELRKNIQNYDCLCINEFVAPSGRNSLEAILDRNGVSHDIDLLSVDIDGDDYYILEGLERLRPRVIICEYNPTIPAEVDLYAEYGNYFGASVSALVRIAKEKGYALVGITETNCVFVQNTLAAAFSEFETSIEVIKSDKQLVHLVTSYAGDYVICGRAPYGIAVPYRGKLTGQWHPFPHGAGIRGVLLRAYRVLRQLAGRMLRGEG